MMTLSANLTHTYLARKPQWIVLALAVAAAAAAHKTAAARYLVRQPLRASGREETGNVLAAQARPRRF